MNMDISMSAIMAALIFGVIGMWLFKEGKRRQQYPVLIIGIVMMIYPYFTPNAKWDWVLGFLLSGLAYKLWNGV